MQVSVETIGSLGRRLKVAVPADKFEQAFADRLRRLSQQVKLPGFRPGKVPVKMVEARFGGQLLEEVAGDLIQTTLQEAIGTQGLKPAGGTKIRRSKPFERGQEFEYTAEFEVYPEIKQLDLKDVAIERPVAAVSDDDVAHTIETIRKQRVTWNPVQRPAAQGDRLTIDFVGRVNGEEFEGGKAQGYPLILGAGSFVEGFEQGLLGAGPNETRRVNVTFPADYRHQPLAGKPVEFEVQVKEIAEPVLPALDEELAKQLGVAEGGGVDKLRADVRANLEREAASRSRAVLRRNVLQALLKANEFEVPAGLVDAEVGRMQQLGQSAGQALPDAEHLRVRARTRVALGLILSEIVQARGLRPDPAKVRARIEEMAADYDAPQKFIEWHYADPQRLGEIESMVIEDRIVEELLAGARTQDRPVGFQELLALDASIH